MPFVGNFAWPLSFRVCWLPGVFFCPLVIKVLFCPLVFICHSKVCFSPFWVWAFWYFQWWLACCSLQFQLICHNQFRFCSGMHTRTVLRGCRVGHCNRCGSDRPIVVVQLGAGGHGRWRAGVAGGSSASEQRVLACRVWKVWTSGCTRWQFGLEWGVVLKWGGFLCGLLLYVGGVPLFEMASKVEDHRLEAGEIICPPLWVKEEWPLDGAFCVSFCFK